jgi:isopentenyl diphosphate isomerase/L-lactate dehydrogenase-like FMN-dependent dehydrogenase
MNRVDERARSRREFLKFLAASPLLAGLPHPALIEAFAQNTTASTAVAGDVIAAAKDAINVFDFEAVARKNLPPAHWGYMASGVDDDATLRANREAFAQYRIRPRRLVNATRLDLTTDLFGTTWDTPVFICPVGGHKMFHPEGEIAVARAAQAKKTLQILSTVTTSSVEDVIKARGGPIWYQLYPTSSLDVRQQLVKRAEAAGCPVLVLTVDLSGGRNMETAERFRRMDTRRCDSCHESGPNGVYTRRPMFTGIDMTGVGVNAPALTWDDVKRLKDSMKMKLVIKGIETREDAELCLKYGVDGILVSNHGGRATETGRATIEALSEIAPAVGNRIPVMVDGGFRRGTDIFKALALGARAVGIGRPYIWGLSAFGQAGVEAVLDILRRELEMVMRQSGVRSAREIGAAYVTSPRR